MKGTTQRLEEKRKSWSAFQVVSRTGEGEIYKLVVKGGGRGGVNDKIEDQKGESSMGREYKRAEEAVIKTVWGNINP